MARIDSLGNFLADIAVLEAEISEIISEFHDKVIEIVYEVLEVALNGIEEQYIDDLFN